MLSGRFYLNYLIPPPHHWYILFQAQNSRSSSTPDRSHSDLPDQTQDSNPNSTPVFLDSGSGPPTTCLRWQLQSPPPPPFPREDTQTHLKNTLDISSAQTEPIVVAHHSQNSVFKVLFGFISNCLYFSLNFSLLGCFWSSPSTDSVSALA